MSNKELDKIIIRGAKEHNLKNVNLTIPKYKMVVFTGVSGSGKTSLAMDTLYAEGQRRYVESLSSYARQFLGVLKKPEVESIIGLSPAIAIDQKTVSHNPRSTVGTMTEIYDYMRLLFSRIGHPHCSNCKREISQQSELQIIDGIYQLAKNQNAKQPIKILLFAPIVKDKKGEYTTLFSNLKAQGYKTIRIDKKMYALNNDISLIKTNKHSIDVVVDRFVLNTKKLEKDRQRLVSSVHSALFLGGGYLIAGIVKDKTFTFPEMPVEVEDHLFSERFACPFCNLSISELEPRNFSFNSPHGACATCDGIGSVLKIDPELILNKNLSVLEGGIFPWANAIERQGWLYKKILDVSDKFDVNLNAPIKDLPDPVLNIFLYGSEKYKFEGLIFNLERRYKQTNSDYIRKEVEKFMYKKTCAVCKGTRLKKEPLAVTIGGVNIYQTSCLNLDSLYTWVKNLTKGDVLSSLEKFIAESIVVEIKSRLKFLLHVGLSYITLHRTSATLSGGESQRIRLASQIGSGLSGILYILDEPSIGLHPKDQQKLIDTLKNLRDMGNTLVVVEHDANTILNADYVVDFGPGAGKLGGEVISAGTPSQIKKDSKSLTGQYLSGKKKVKGYFSANGSIIHNKQLFTSNFNTLEKEIKILNCREHNLKGINASFKLGKINCVTGVSGSGKSTLVSETLLKQIRHELGLKNDKSPGKNDGFVGIENINKIIDIDQTPIGKTPRSNPATYTKAFDYIRDLFAITKESKIRGYSKGKFSFNVKGGRCEVCKGDGQIKIEMQFMPDVYIDCEACAGKRYSRDVLEVEYKGKNISEILEMTVEDALEFFKNSLPIKRKIQMLYDVGLGYIQLGQPAPTLSGGESQRVKLASELSKIQTGKTLYILDEPTTGLHFADLERLIGIIKQLAHYKNTVVIVEHNLDIIKNSDYILDLGPEGGDAGGKIIYSGDIKGLLECKKSYTGQVLKQYLESF